MRKSIVLIMVLTLVATIWSHGGFDNISVCLDFWEETDLYCDLYNLYVDGYNFCLDIIERIS